MIYRDPNYSKDDRQWAELMDALNKQKQAILTKDTTPNNGKSFDRTGYIALYRIDHIQVTDSEMSFQFVERLADLK